MSDPDYLPFHPDPTVPTFVPPPGAVDAHCHVFGPAARFPFAPGRKYTPVDAPKEQLYALRDFLGFTRNVIVQASCHGRDNTAMLDAIAAAKGLSRGVAIVGEDVTLHELTKLHDGGVRGVRFNFVKRLMDGTPREAYLRIAERVTRLGWHIVVYMENEDLEGLEPFLAQLPGTVVVDHMGRPNVSEGVEGAGFLRFLRFMETHQNLWVKVSCPERMTVAGPPYDDIVPFAARLVERFPNRVLWGTDWPHPNMKSHIPDDGALVDIIPRIAPTAEAQHRLLVSNPMRLYWPEEALG